MDQLAKVYELETSGRWKECATVSTAKIYQAAPVLATAALPSARGSTQN